VLGGMTVGREDQSERLGIGREDRAVARCWKNWKGSSLTRHVSALIFSRRLTSGNVTLMMRSPSLM